MRMIGKWRIVMEGDTDAITMAPWWRKGLDYLLDRLFKGEEVDPKALEYYQVKVRPLGDDDEIISVPRGD